MEILRIEGLSKVFGTGRLEVRALEDINLSVAAGDLVALLGPVEADIHDAQRKAHGWLTWDDEPGTTMPHGPSAFLLQSPAQTEVVQSAGTEAPAVALNAPL